MKRGGGGGGGDRNGIVVVCEEHLCVKPLCWQAVGLRKKVSKIHNDRVVDLCVERERREGEGGSGRGREWERKGERGVRCECVRMHTTARICIGTHPMACFKKIS